MSGMIKEAPLKYMAVFYVEADSREALETAVEYVARRMEISKVVYACSPCVCVCKTELEWDGTRLTVRSCVKRAVYAAAKLLVEAYGWFGWKAIQLIKYKEYTP